MTKEYLYSLFYQSVYTYDFIKSNLDEFFDSNVCIPKGVSRHPYADELHALAEGVECEYKLGASFVPLDNIGIIRIKPSEPIYEWQWLYYSKFEGKAFLTPNFYNEHEAKKELQEGHTRIEETRRERK